MSTEIKPEVEVDPFRYGWRTVRRRQPNGRLGIETIGLTLDDLLYPQEGDQAVHSIQHGDICRYLHLVFEARLQTVARSLVLSDHRIDYDVAGVRPVGPDVAVFFEVDDPDSAATFDQARYHARPVLAVEVASPDTRKNDFGIKKTIYHRAGVEQYVIIDPRPLNRRRPLSLHGFVRTEAGYEPQPMDAERGLWLGPLGIWLNHDAQEQVFCLDGASGDRIGTYHDQVDGRLAAEARAEEERQRADAERHRAEEERQRADNLEAQLRAMREEIERLRGGG